MTEIILIRIMMVIKIIMNHVDCVDDSGHDNDNGNCCDFDGNYDNDYDAWEGVSHKDDNDDDDDTHQCDALHILYHMILTIHIMMRITILITTITDAWEGVTHEDDDIFDEDDHIFEDDDTDRCVGRRCTL